MHTDQPLDLNYCQITSILRRFDIVRRSPELVKDSMMDIREPVKVTLTRYMMLIGGTKNII